MSVYGLYAFEHLWRSRYWWENVSSAFSSSRTVILTGLAMMKEVFPDVNLMVLLCEGPWNHTIMRTQKGIQTVSLWALAWRANTEGICPLHCDLLRKISSLGQHTSAEGFLVIIWMWWHQLKVDSKGYTFFNCLL